MVVGTVAIGLSCNNDPAAPEQPESDPNQSVEASVGQNARDLGEQGIVHISESRQTGAITPEAAKFIVDGLFDEDFIYNALAHATLSPLSDRNFDLTPIVLALYEYRAETLEDSDVLAATSFRVFRQALIVGRQDLPEHYAVIFIAASSIDRAHDVLLQHGLSAIVIAEGADRGLAFPEDQESRAWEAFDGDPDSEEYILNYFDPHLAHRNTVPGHR